MFKYFLLLTIFTTVCDWSIVFALDYRLSGEVIPDFYNISIKPYLFETDGDKRFTFDGRVEIKLHSTVDGVQSITLHKDYLNISEALLYEAVGPYYEEIPVDSLSYETETDKLTVPLRNSLKQLTAYILSFTYTGSIRNGTAGLFPTYYQNAQGDITWITLTQLQRIDARVVFPCFDEPAFKAEFQLHLSRPKNYSSFFNTMLLSTQPDEADREIDNFDSTPLMSTYLVAFMIAPYTKRGTNEVSILSRPEFYEETEFAYNVTLKIISAYENLFDQSYKSLGNKIFQEASAPLFPHNGMENWGLILYKDAVLVQHPNYTDGWANKEYMTMIIVHETAHMWFGDSVTFKWWSYFWLNEAFARYYQFFLTNEIYPEYQLDQQFVVNQVHYIFGFDAVNTTQPMTSPPETIQTPSQIASKFSSIAYNKGAAIVRMFCNIMGKTNFEMAIRGYLKENSLKNTVPEDLFKHLKSYWPRTSEINLDTFFNDWTAQVGFPMITVSLSNDSKNIVLQQNRFLLNPNDGSDATLLYTIPITLATNVDNNFYNLTPKFFFNKTNSVSFELNSPIDWVILNLQQSNYYRVFYTEPILNNIHKALFLKSYGGIHVVNRAQLIDDLFSYGRIGLVDYENVFEFIEYMNNEVEYLPWYAAFNGLSLVAQRMQPDQQKNFGAFLYQIGRNIYTSLGFGRENDTVLDIYNRNKLVTWLCKYDLGDCGMQAEAIFLQMQQDQMKPSPDFRETLYCAANRENVHVFWTLSDMYKNESLSSEQEMLIRAMGCTKFDINVEAFYTFLMNMVPQSHITIGIKALFKSNQENIDRVFYMIKETFENLAQKLGSFSAVANIIDDLADYFTTEQQKMDLEQFIVDHGDSFGTAKSTLDQSVKKVESNLAWADTRLKNLVDYLKYKNVANMSQLSVTLMALVSLFYLILQ